MPTPAPPSRTRLALFSGLAVALALGALELAARATVSLAPAGRFEQLERICVSLGRGEATAIFEPDEDRFWRLRPGVTLGPPTRNAKGEISLWWGFVSDEAGRRDPPEPPRPAGAERVLCLGDSTTFGAGAGAREAWPYRLRVAPRAPGVRPRTAYNAGVPGYSSTQGARYLAELLPALRPDAVVITFGNNDGWSWGNRSDAAQLTARRGGWRGLARRLTRRSRLAGLLARALRPPAPAATGDRWTKAVVGNRIAETPGFVPRVSVAEYEANLRAMVARATGAGARVALVVWPWYLELTGAGRPRAAYQAATRRVGATPGVALVDLPAEFRAAGLDPRAVYLDGAHVDGAGHRVVAAAVGRALDAGAGDAPDAGASPAGPGGAADPDENPGSGRGLPRSPGPAPQAGPPAGR